mmetsp:Transcript_31187/g.70491  ORF Transcript_31187/g.70491 Transcript_31187/m.70491 type:complete len:207 (-) Transcript_31187:700-1320(-)
MFCVPGKPAGRVHTRNTCQAPGTTAAPKINSRPTWAGAPSRFIPHNRSHARSSTKSSTLSLSARRYCYTVHLTSFLPAADAGERRGTISDMPLATRILRRRLVATCIPGRQPCWAASGRRPAFTGERQPLVASISSIAPAARCAAASFDHATARRIVDDEIHRTAPDLHAQHGGTQVVEKIRVQRDRHCCVDTEGRHTHASSRSEC